MHAQQVRYSGSVQQHIIQLHQDPRNSSFSVDCLSTPEKIPPTATALSRHTDVSPKAFSLLRNSVHAAFLLAEVHLVPATTAAC